MNVGGSAWWAAERAWVAWLSGQGHFVTHLANATGNSPHTEAPMMTFGDQVVRAPDIEAKIEGRSTYWEVKYRTRARVDPTTGTSEHWMSFDSFADYLEVDRRAAPVHVALFEAATATRPGRWLTAHVDAIREAGREETRAGRDGEPVRAWVWPSSAMTVVVGPSDPDVSPAQVPVLTDEGRPESSEVPLDELAPIERTIRRTRRARVDAAEPVAPVAAVKPVERALEADNASGLDVLSRTLGLTTTPLYSVLRLGAFGCDLEEVLGLLDYGIRVFLITGPDPDGAVEGRELEHFADARMLEWAVLEDEPATTGWVVDGDPGALARPGVDETLARADETGALNLGQYRVVHTPAEADVQVTAGAGTGKTETMVERLVFLLSVGAGRAGADGRPTDLDPADIALITFTNDAAREIRARLSRTLTLRRRLAPSAVQPLSWLLGVGSMQISTIHSFAKSLVQRHGALLGLSPGFAVRRNLVTFRRLVQEETSGHLTRLFDERQAWTVPPAHAWEKHVEKLWDALGGNGIDLLGWGSDDVDQLADVDWGGQDLPPVHEDVAGSLRATLYRVATRYAEACRDSDSLPPDALVPAAIAVLEGSSDPIGPPVLFVDEFQDTDPLQMRLLMSLRQRASTRLFVVGDAKQGIYRFRGAEGDAFQQLEERFVDAGIAPPQKLGLTWNFRSQPTLLNSLHPHFARWGDAGLLSYRDSDRLRPAAGTDGAAAPLELRPVSYGARFGGFVGEAAAVVQQWRQAEPDASIAVLCRINRHAMDVHRELRARGEPSELVVGGDFFRTEAVLELRSFLEAVVSPHDAAALLEVAETRWADGLLGSEPPTLAGGDEVWSEAVGALRPWQERLIAGSGPACLARDDLEALRARVVSVRRAALQGSTLEWLVECVRAFAPHSVGRAGDEGLDRVRYLRCLDHSITLLDDALGDSPVTIDRVLAWLKLKIDTDFQEDEPLDSEQLGGRTTALTVHKAKGLEFDMVLVPHTWLDFSPHDGVETRTAVLRGHDGRPRFAWDWKAQTLRFSNVDQASRHLWDLDSHETTKEETRLLYVALTRAKRHAAAFVGQPKPAGTPTSWSDLLRMGDR